MNISMNNFYPLVAFLLVWNLKSVVQMRSPWGKIPPTFYTWSVAQLVHMLGNWYTIC